MNWLIEVVIGVIVCILFIAGMKRGLIRQVLEIVGIIAAFIGAFSLAHYAAAYLESRFDVPYRIALAAAAVGLFVGIILLFRLAGLLLQKVVGLTPLGSVDKVGGGVLGAVKGVLLVSLLLVIIMNLPLPREVKSAFEEDPVAAAIHPVLPKLFDIVLSRSPGRLNFEKVIRPGDAKALKGVKDRAKDVEEELQKRKTIEGMQ